MKNKRKDLEEKLTHIITIQGKVTNTKIATIDGIEVTSTNPDLRGKNGQATGKLISVLNGENRINEPNSAGQNPEIYYRLVHESSGELIQVQPIPSKKFPFLVEQIVVFKKDISKVVAEKILQEYNFPFREGMDSSRGKRYFYKTGPKYILHIPKNKLSNFNKTIQKHTEIYESFAADWRIQKD